MLSTLSCEAEEIEVQAALNEKMAEFTANAKQFTMDGGILDDYRDDEDYKTAKKDLSHLKKAMASNWVEQPRQRKMRINYNEAVSPPYNFGRLPHFAELLSSLFSRHVHMSAGHASSSSTAGLRESRQTGCLLVWSPS
jgi:hypothetical protein